MKHQLNNRLFYPSHHVWVSADKINVFSSKIIDKGDTIIMGGEQVKVKASKSAKPTDSNRFNQNVMFYELDVEKC